MSTIKDVQNLANELLNTTFSFRANGCNFSINPKTDLNYSFKFDNAKRRFGCCKYGKKIITLSKPLCSVNLDKIDGKIKDTILHEIAHALCVYVYGRVKGRGHGTNWVNIAVQIGCDGKRCYDSSKVEKPDSKYTMACDHCDNEFPMHRKPKRSYSCAQCTTVYDPKYKLRLIQNY